MANSRLRMLSGLDIQNDDNETSKLTSLNASSSEPQPLGTVEEAVEEAVKEPVQQTDSEFEQQIADFKSRFPDKKDRIEALESRIDDHLQTIDLKDSYIDDINIVLRQCNDILRTYHSQANEIPKPSMRRRNSLGRLVEGAFYESITKPQYSTSLNEKKSNLDGYIYSLPSEHPLKHLLTAPCYNSLNELAVTPPELRTALSYAVDKDSIYKANDNTSAILTELSNQKRTIYQEIDEIKEEIALLKSSIKSIVCHEDLSYYTKKTAA